MLSQRRYELALSGVPWDLLGPLQRDARIVLQRCPADVPSIGPISYVAELPGYERVETLVDLGNLRGGLPSLSLVVTPHAADFGSLAIEFTGLPEPGEIAHAGLTGTVTLTSRTGEAYDVYIADSPREVPPFEGVPIGDYTIRFTPDHGLLSTMQSDSTAKAVQIVEGRTARASIDLSETGSLEVQVLDSRGTIHRGLAVFRLRRLSSGVPSKDSIVDFERGPYTIRSLPPGEYTITMDAPFKARSPQAAVVEVVPGMTGIWMQESDP